MNAPVDFRQSPQLLAQAFAALRAERGLRHRDAAATLGVSEGEAIAAHVGADATLRARRLKGGFPDFLRRIESLGPVMALTRNDSVVHEKVGTYVNLSHEGHVGLALGEQIDLRIFYSHWKHGFAVAEDTPRGVQKSFQVYDAAGAAVHKIFLKDASDAEAYERLAEEWCAADQTPGVAVTAPATKAPPRPDVEIDVDQFQLAWAGMKDTHEFFGLLKKFGVARTQALRLAGEEFASRAGHGATQAMLEAAARDGVAIMCFVGNPGIIQIHTGPVANVKVMGDWLNVLDPGFNLHLRADRIAETWVVRKPTTEGIVTSLEIFDAAGETIAMFFGKRKPGIPELESWRALVAALPGA
jgi:putative hemin transport protein